MDENSRADAAAEGATPSGDAPAEANGVAAAGEGEAPEVKADAVEEEKDNTKTLDEYLAEQAAKRAQIGAKKEARQADSADAEALGKRLEKQDSEDYYKIQKVRRQAWAYVHTDTPLTLLPLDRSAPSDSARRRRSRCLRLSRASTPHPPPVVVVLPVAVEGIVAEVRRGAEEVTVVVEHHEVQHEVVVVVPAVVEQT